MLPAVWWPTSQMREVGHPPAHRSKTAKGEAAEGGGGAKVGQPPDISADPVLTVPHLTPDLLLTDLCKREEPTVTAGPSR